MGARQKSNDLDYMPSNQVYRLRDGWYCMVDGREFGTWPDEGSARAGLATETRRAQHRRDRDEQTTSDL